MKVRTLSPQLQEVAIRELNEVPSQIEENVNHIKDWLAKQKHLKYKNDDQLILNFLRGSKFSLQKAKTKIDSYYSFRTFAPEVALNLDPHQPILRKIVRSGTGMLLPLPKDNPATPRIILLCPGNYNPNELPLEALLKATIMGISMLLNTDDNCVVAGMRVLVDFKALPFASVLQATPSLMRKAVVAYETALPMRLKSVHVINVPKYTEKALNIFKQLLSKKIAERMQIYSDNWEAIYNDIPKSCLPYEYGGEGGSFADIHADWITLVENHRELLVEESNYYSDESQRIDGAIFEMEGSFRKLELD